MTRRTAMVALAGVLTTACQSSASPSWLRFESVDLADSVAIDVPAPRMFCDGTRFIDRSGLYFVDVSTGEISDVLQLPRNPDDGRTGRVSCIGTRLFTVPPDTGEAYRSDDGGAWETIRTGTTELSITDLLASTDGLLFRVITSTDRSVLPKIERSDDAGETWNDLPTPMTLPEVGEAEVAELIGVEGLLEYRVIDGRNSGVVRTDLDGRNPIVSVDFIREIESPSPVWTDDSGSLATQGTSEDNDHPQFAVDNYWRNDSDEKDRSIFEWQPILITGLLDPSGAMAGSPKQVAVDAEGVVWLSYAQRLWRSTTAWNEDASDDVLVGRSCSALEQDRGPNVGGPGDVRFTHTGDAPVLIGVVQGTSGIQWRAPVVLVDDRPTYDPLDPGETTELTSLDDAVIIADLQGRCLAVLGDGDGGDVDVANF
ncbi:MAG: hypothetical protein AB8H79_20540 [Myxococcota bacterium]